MTTTREPRARTPEEIRSLYRRVWDMVLHLVHPTALYVMVELVADSHLSRSPLVSESRGYGWLFYVLFLCQYLGAWAVFYSTLLRDAGFRSRAALVLTLWAVVLATAQLLAFPEAAQIGTGLAVALLLAHCVPAVVGWAITFTRWRTLKRRLSRVIGEGAADKATDSGDPAS